ncbi:MAG TPA: hypothetical protein VFL57_14250 [Bryobacteraceae bacterium]|nr:hypothetical protein [Bryobacteraceae bacterium]
MRTLAYISVFVMGCVGAAGQSRTQPAAGVAPDWDVRARLVELAKHTRALEPVLAAVKPEEWVAKGASATYVNQARSVRALAMHVIASSAKLAEQPDRLSTGLETLFRIQTLEQFSESLAEGIRRYQGADIANRFMEAMAPVSGSRELLRQHVLDVAAMREQEFEVVSAEAQRCRSNIIRQEDSSSRQRRDRRVNR